MTIGPIDWGAHPPETLETVAAVLLAQEHPSVLRRTPSSGDGGVDVLVAQDDGWHVYQIKSFTGRVKAAQRAQIASSLEEAVRDPRLNGRSIVAWSLAVPINPTSGEQAWFEDLTSSCAFPSTWKDKTWWDSMASKYTHVIDYYFRDGRERIARRLEAMTRPSDLLDRPPSAIDVGGHLDVMRRALNVEDPHYRYEFLTGDAPNADGMLPSGAVLICSYLCEDGSYWTVFVIPKHNYASEDAPIHAEITIKAFDEELGIDIRKELKDFRDFGCAFDVPHGALTGELIAPGGLSTQFDGRACLITPLPPTDGLLKSRLRLTSASGEVLHQVKMETTSRSSGERGGHEIQVQDPTGMLRLVVRVAPPDDGGTSEWKLSLSDYDNKPVVDLLPLVQLMGTALRGGVSLEWMVEYGAETLASHDIDSVPVDTSTDVDGALWLLELLNKLQGYVRETVLFSEHFTNTELRELEETVAMISEGEIRGTWSGLTFTLREGVDRQSIETLFAKGGHLLLSNNLTLQLGDRVYDLGPGYRLHTNAVLADKQPLDHRKIAIVPGPDPSTVQGLGEFDKTSKAA